MVEKKDGLAPSESGAIITTDTHIYIYFLSAAENMVVPFQVQYYISSSWIPSRKGYITPDEQ